jgi:hypothetical protein
LLEYARVPQFQGGTVKGIALLARNRSLECGAQQTNGLGIEPVLVLVKPDRHDAEKRIANFSAVKNGN